MKIPLFRQNQPCFSSWKGAVLGGLLASGLLVSCPVHAEISEPETVFYGKIVNRTSGQEYLLTHGTLSWVISRPDGSRLTLNGSLEPLNNGAYSYRLKVPHEALAYGLSVSASAVPLGTKPAACSHVQIMVDGSFATIMAPGASTFGVAQNLRATTYRLDLEVLNPLTDATGSGIPDWWKALYGVTDPNADPTGDGWSNLQKFLIGANPNQDYRIPALRTSELVAYADGTTGMRLQTLDSDSGATNVFYALKTLPQSGVFYLRNSSANATTVQTPLAVGASFTQEDINNGRLLFFHQGNGVPAVPDSFQISLHDENPNHPVTNSVVTLNVYRPNYPDATLQTAAAFAAAPATTTNIAGLSFEEQQMVLNYYLSRNQGYVIWDASRASTPQTIAVPSSGLSQPQYAKYVSAHGRDRQYVFVAGAGDDQLSGGMENDILISGRGSDTLRGGGGGDLFIIPGPSAGNVAIQDFNASENDALDISRVLLGSSTSLANYLQVTNSGSDSLLLINFTGIGANFTNLVVTLLGTRLSQEDLQSMVDNGNLVTGQKVTVPRISIVASIQAASQNGLVPGEFTLTRNSGIATSLTVNLQITGSAINGNDYQYVAAQATFATFGTLFGLLIAYRSGLIKATENFKLMIVGATGAIAVTCLVGWILAMFGREIPYIHQSGTIGIVFSLFVVAIAALNLVLDFDFIENGAAAGAPKYMEWFAAAGLLVTLVWLYLEILRLLSKLNSRK